MKDNKLEAFERQALKAAKAMPKISDAEWKTIQKSSEIIKDEMNAREKRREFEDASKKLTHYIAEQNAQPFETNELLRELLDEIADMKEEQEEDRKRQESAQNGQNTFNLLMFAIGLLTLIATIIGITS